MSKIYIGQVYEVSDEYHEGPELLALVQCDIHRVVALGLSAIEGISPNRWIEPVDVEESAYDITEKELSRILGTEKGNWKYVGMIANFLELRENVNVQVL